MRRNIKIRPSKQASIPGFIVGLIFVGIGIFVAIPNVGAFGVLWTGVAIVITITNGINAFGSKGIPSEEIYIEDDYEYNDSINKENLYKREIDFEEKLRKLKSLKDDGIISDVEYEMKRTEILNNIK